MSRDERLHVRVENVSEERNTKTSEDFLKV